MSVTPRGAVRLLRRPASARRLEILIRHRHPGRRRCRQFADDCRLFAVHISMGVEARRGIGLAQCPWETPEAG